MKDRILLIKLKQAVSVLFLECCTKKQENFLLLVPKLQFGNPGTGSCASCGKRSLRGVRSQAGAWERAVWVAGKACLKYICFLSVLGFILIFLSAAGYCSKNDFIIAIDIGHSIKKYGAASSRGIGEFYFNQSLAGLLHKALVQQGYSKAFLINESGSNISLSQRVHIAHERNADIFISIHHDSVQPQYLSSWNYKGKKHLYCDRFHGFSIFYSEKNGQPEKSLEFAHLLGQGLLNNGLAPSLHHAEKIKGENRKLVDKDKGIYQFDELTVLKKNKIPSILFECGIILNRNEEILLNDSAYKNKIVKSIVYSINKIYENTNEFREQDKQINSE